MTERKVKIINPSGLHLRPAGVLCERALEFQSNVTFRYGGTSVANAKSVLSILGACIRCRDEIELICDGTDEDEAMKALLTAIEDGLGEG